jgi:hypothetical protein
MISPVGSRESFNASGNRLDHAIIRSVHAKARLFDLCQGTLFATNSPRPSERRRIQVLSAPDGWSLWIADV